MREIDEGDHDTVVFLCGSQMGKTEVICNTAGRRLQDDPAPVLYFGPTESFIEDMWEPKFRQMLKSVPALWERLEKGKAEKKTLKRIGGVTARFGWAGSASQLAGATACLVYVDERDRMPSVKNEGDPKALADQRREVYPDGKTIVTSTPTEGHTEPYVHPDTGLEHWEVSDQIQSPSWRLWQQGTRYERAWPCPDCGDYFIPRFKQLWWPDGCTAYEALDATRLVCPHCGSMIDAEHQEDMNQRGVYVAPGQTVDQEGVVHGDPPASTTASFWCSGLMTRSKTWGQLAYRWIEAQRSGDPDVIQSIVNTGFGELYSVAGDAPPASAVEALRLPYRLGQHVNGVERITMGVDVQQDRLYYTVRGWGRDLESWHLAHGEIIGDTLEDQVWEALDTFRDRWFCGLPIERCFVDSGYRTSQVYGFCRQRKQWAVPAKGQQTMGKPLSKAFVDTTTRGKPLKSGLSLWHVNTDYFKRWIHERIERDPDLPGGFHLAEDTSDDYCEQLISEARLVKPSGRVTWVQLRKDNHYLDCEMLALAAAHSLQLQFKTSEDPAPGAKPAPAVSKQQQREQPGRDPFAGSEYSGWFGKD